MQEIKHFAYNDELTNLLFNIYYSFIEKNNLKHYAELIQIYIIYYYLHMKNVVVFMAFNPVSLSLRKWS